uniref:Calmodulin 2 n=1 Tax=Cryptocotyle lingua TaxID=66766 RepID=A0A7U0TJ17_9TREM|nr:calmodulin 2 [Cryptocotyle lingua]
MVDTLSKDELEKLRWAFSVYDTNGDGSIDARELEAVLARVGRRPTPTEVANILKRFDTNQDGKINFPEFLVMMMKKKKFASLETDLRRAFQFFDENKDGFISQEELKSVLKMFGGTFKNLDAETIMKEADENGDGRLDYEEFIALMADWTF